jgi:DNA-binding NarL/FixJ family response regulator
MKAEITVLIADDHPIFRKGLLQVIATDPQLKVIAEADDGEAALGQIRALGPQVVVLDVDMPNKDGFDVARAIREERLSIEIIFLTMHKDERFFNAALDLGVKGYLLKDSAVTEIIGGIKAVASGQNYISPPLSTYLVKRSQRAAALRDETRGIGGLTPTERRVLRLISEYKTTRDIAQELFISTRTVEHHRANISTKLELRGSHSLLKFALEHKSELS